MDLSQLNDQHKAKLKQFRDTFKDVALPDGSSRDLFLLRWLIAREFDLAKAEKMLRDSLEWRRKNKVDAIEEFNSPEVLTKYFPAGFVGRDKFKHPLWVVRYGLADLKGILNSAKKKDYIMHVIKLVETNVRTVQSNPAKYQYKLGDSMVQSTIIFDMHGFGMKHITFKPAMDTALAIVQMYEANYPELLRKVFIVNAPKVFSIAFSMIKPFLHERTKNKISIFSHEPTVWKQAILAEVNADELPAAYGGTMTDPDGNPNCITMVNMGGEVPKSYYFNNKPKSDIENKKSLTVASGSKSQLEYEVKVANSILRWEFYSEDSDIAYSVYRKQEAELIAVVPRERVDSHIIHEEGELHCDHPGTYVFEFDNNYSWLSSKKVHYNIAVIPPSEAQTNGLTNGTQL